MAGSRFAVKELAGRETEAIEDQELNPAARLFLGLQAAVALNQFALVETESRNSRPHRAGLLY